MYELLKYAGGRGIGKKLFNLCKEKAREIGSKKVYISANDSEATQQFYLGLGCKDAVEINQKMLDEEPHDRQVEYIVKSQSWDRKRVQDRKKGLDNKGEI